MTRNLIALLSLSALALLSMSAEATDDRKWKQSQPVESYPPGTPSGNAITPQMAFDHNGNAMVVWQLSVGGISHIWASRYTVSDHHWNTAAQLEFSTGGGSSPQIAVDANGNAVAVWSQAEGIQARSFTVSGAWGVTTSLQAVAGSSSSPQIAIDANGNALAVWHQLDGSTNRVWSSHHTLNATQWDTTQSLDANMGNAVFAQIAMDTAGNALAVWRQSDSNAHTSIWSSRYTKTGTPGWGAAKPVESNPGDAVSPQVSFDGAGNARAIWSEFDTDVARNRIWSGRYTASTDQWSGVAAVESNAGDSSAPQVTLDASGNALAVWYQFDSVHNFNNIWANRFTLSTGQWDSPALLQNDTTSKVFSPSSPSIAMDANGSAVVVWYQRQPPPAPAVSGIYAARYTPGNPVFATSWTGAALIESDDRGNALLPRVAFDAGGIAMAVWYQSDGSRSAIVSSRYAGKPTFVYVTGAGFAVLTAFPGTGALTPTSGSPFSVGTQAAFTIDPLARFAYSVYAGFGPGLVTQYRINAGTGAPEVVSGNSIDAGRTPQDVRVSSSGRLYTTDANVGIFAPPATGSVRSYQLDATSGVPVAIQGGVVNAGLSTRAIAIHPTASLLFAANYNSNTVSVFLIGGAGQPIPWGSPVATASQPTALEIDPSGHFLYVANWASSSISAYSINVSAATLTPVPGSPFATGGTKPVEVHVDPLGRFVYAISAVSGALDVYRINAQSGALTPVAGSPFSIGSLTNSLAVDPSGNFIYVTNESAYTVSVFSINATTGAPTPIAGSPFATGLGWPADILHINVAQPAD